MPQKLSKTRKMYRQIILQEGKRAIIFQRLADGGVFAVCGPLDHNGCIKYQHARWYTPERGRWNRAPGGVK